MKIKNLIKNVMTLTGSSVLKMIQEESIPNVDLFVRESLQNSLDAGKEECDNILVQYLVNTFNSYDLANELEEIGEAINNVYGNSECNYIAIKDTNTKGLLGTHILENGKDNNLYNLVYDMMTGSKHLIQVVLGELVNLYIIDLVLDYVFIIQEHMRVVFIS